MHQSELIADWELLHGVEVVAPYTLCVRFDDGAEQTIDVLPVLGGELYEPLRDLHTLVWPNGADFDPATLHDWPRYQTDFVEMVKRWNADLASSPRDHQSR